MRTRKITTLLLSLTLLLTTALSGCDWAKADRRIAVGGYSLHLGTEAAAKSALAFKRYGRLQPAAYVLLLHRLDNLTEASQRVNTELDKLPTIDRASATGLIEAINNYLGVLDGVLADQLLTQLDSQTLTAVRSYLTGARIVASGIQSAILTLKKPTPSNNVLVDGAVAKSFSAEQAKNKDFNVNDALLVADVVNIGALFASQLASVQGLDAVAVKNKRDAKFRELRDWFKAELALNQ